MHIRTLCTLLVLLLAATPLSAVSAKEKKGAAKPRVFDGYAGMKWGTDAHTVLRTYPGLQPAQEGAEFILRQKNPNREMGQRAFIFRDNKLVAVTVKFNASYVKRNGADRLLAIHQQYYGPGTRDRSSTAHMASHIWETPRTRITFAYSPKYPDMTAVLFQKKDKSAPAAPPSASTPPPPAAPPAPLPPASATPSLPPGHPAITGSKPIPAGPLNLPKGHPPIPGLAPQK
jgi:hypothetical protein